MTIPEALDKALKVIMSCETYGQWRAANEYISLFCKGKYNGKDKETRISNMQYLFNMLYIQHGIVLRKQYPIKRDSLKCL